MLRVGDAVGRRLEDDLEALWALHHHPAGGPAPAGMGLMGVCTQPTAAPFTAMAGTAAMVHPSWSGPLVQQGMVIQVNLKKKDSGEPVWLASLVAMS